MGRLRTQFASVALVLCLLGSAHAGEATVAVASNFLATAERLVATFEADTEHQITLAHGSTGRLYAQIVGGAPFDVFLSADADRPRRLAQDTLAATPVTYALGQLVLVVQPELGFEIAGKRIALADPEVAPYGKAAEEALMAMGLARENVTLLLADSVGQAASFFATGNAEAALIAAAQLPDLPVAADVKSLDGLHAPIRQDAVVLRRAHQNAAATDFAAFLVSPKGQAIIVEAGYGLPK